MNMPAEKDQCVFWQKSVERATNYCTTNGIIQVTLSATFATATAALVTFAQSDANVKEVIYRFVLPAMSIMILALSANVYSWIEEQLTYLSHFGSYKGFLGKPMSYENWWYRLADYGAEHMKKRGFFWLQYEVLLFLLRSTVSMKNIYAFYLLLYFVTPYASLLLVRDKVELMNSYLLIFVVQAVIGSVALRSAVFVRLYGAEVCELCIAGDAHKDAGEGRTVVESVDPLVKGGTTEHDTGASTSAKGQLT